MRNLVEGETKPMDVTLYDGAGATRVAIDGTGLTVGLKLRDRNGGEVNVTGDVSWLAPTSGVVRFTPAVGDFTAARSPYKARWTVRDLTNTVAMYPNGEADRWVVRK